MESNEKKIASRISRERDPGIFLAKVDRKKSAKPLEMCCGKQVCANGSGGSVANDVG
jgi:hypothetical protein